MIGFWKTRNDTYLYIIHRIVGDSVDVLQIYVPKQPNPKIDIMPSVSLEFFQDAYVIGELKQTDDISAFNKLSVTNKKKCIREIFK